MQSHSDSVRKETAHKTVRNVLMWFLLTKKYKQGWCKAIAVSAAGTVGPKKAGYVSDFVSDTFFMYALSALSFRTTLRWGCQIYFCIEPREVVNGL
jgi:hypothetical protein